MLMFTSVLGTGGEGFAVTLGVGETGVEGRTDWLGIGDSEGEADTDKDAL